MIPAQVKKPLFKFFYTLFIFVSFFAISLTIKKTYAIDIYTIEDLDSIRNDLTGDHVLMNDLDFNSVASYSDPSNMTLYTTGEGWDPIGTEESGSEFSGTFNGNGYEISNLFIDNSDGRFVGMFGVISSSSVTNVGVVNATITAPSTVGILVGYNIDYSIIEDSWVSGDVTGLSVEAGGLVGSNASIIDSSYSSANVVGGRHVGGLAGLNWRTIENSYSTGSVTGDNHVGGLVGYNSSNGIILTSYSLSDTNGYTSVGGIVGTNAGIIENTYSQGSVTGTSSWVGGLVGDNVTSGSIINTYTTGAITGTTTITTGGLVGANIGFITDSFWDTQTSGIESSAGGTGKTTEEMMSLSTFNDTETEGLDTPWDIIGIENFNEGDPTIWYINGFVDYPRLFWEFDGYTPPEDPDDEDSPEVMGVSVFHPDTRCHWKKPGEPTWIKLEKMTKDGVSGMLLTWTQYGANKVNIKIDDGTGNYPWKVAETLNDGSEFLENVQPWQSIMIKPINHCREGEYSQPVSFSAYPYGWYSINPTTKVSSSNSSITSDSNVLGTSTNDSSEDTEENQMVPDTGNNDILYITVSLSIISLSAYFVLNGKSRKLALRGFERRISKEL